MHEPMQPSGRRGSGFAGSAGGAPSRGRRRRRFGGGSLQYRGASGYSRDSTLARIVQPALQRRGERVALIGLAAAARPQLVQRLAAAGEHRCTASAQNAGCSHVGPFAAAAAVVRDGQVAEQRRTRQLVEHRVGPRDVGSRCRARCCSRARGRHAPSAPSTPPASSPPPKVRPPLATSAFSPASAPVSRPPDTAALPSLSGSCTA